MGFRGRILVLVAVVLLQEVVLSIVLFNVNEDDFKGTTTGQEDMRDDLYGVIGAVDYGNDIWHSWDIYAPDHSSSGPKNYTFFLNVTMMDLEPAKESDIESSLIIQMTTDGQPDWCADFLKILDHKYCGVLNSDDTPLTIIEKHVRFMRVDFRSDDSTTGDGFIASYEWKEEK